MKNLLLVILFSLFISTSAQAYEMVVKYEPKTVTVGGVKIKGVPEYAVYLNVHGKDEVDSVFAELRVLGVPASAVGYDPARPGKNFTQIRIEGFVLDVPKR